MVQDIWRELAVYIPSAHEILAAVITLDRTEASLLVVTTLWILICFFPLTGVDHREVLTALTYVLFLVMSGVLLAVSDPIRLLKKDDFGKSILLIIFLTLIGFCRWILFSWRSMRKDKKIAMR